MGIMMLWLNRQLKTFLNLVVGNRLSLVKLLCLMVFLFETLQPINSLAMELNDTRVWINVGPTAGHAKIRARPSKSSEIIGEIDDGSFIDLIGWSILPDDNKNSPRTWLEVPTGRTKSNGNIEYGYIASWLVSFEEPFKKEALITGTKRVRLREIPNGSVIQWLIPDTPVEAVASIPCWTKVRYKNWTGWVDTKYIEILEENE